MRRHAIAFVAGCCQHWRISGRDAEAAGKRGGFSQKSGRLDAHRFGPEFAD
jgi:hypothetical protein